MGDSRVGSPKSRRNSRDFDLSEFPPLGESMGAIAGASGAAVATAGTGAVKAGLGSASAIGKPLYTDKATVLKQQLEFAKVCVEVEASSTLPSSILVDLGEGNSVDVDVELGGTPMGDLQVDLGIDRGRREEVVGSVNKSGVDLVFPVDSGACVDVQATGIGVVENA
ncbi:hypothetical protein V6N12_038531 [Hibiscus sabdariffa]|uniref:Uncharacterized protein n=1 Tax=Hibiscus sabdariffa TaxID=183260 RepID=A0ABR2AHT3_9ROSI